MTSHIDLDALVLARGAHDDRGQGVCLLEAVAWWAHQPHSDHPPCVSPVLGTFGRSWNDALPGDRRHILKEFVPLLPGTAGDGMDLARSYLALDWLARLCAPAFLDLMPALAPHAAALRGLPRLLNAASVEAAKPILSAAWAAARAAARATAGDAAWVAAGAAARAAARDAAGDAAGAAAWAAAGDAAWAAAGDAVRDAAGAAARDAAWDAAWAAAWAAAGAAACWAAARAAARAALEPTVLALQDSALTLYKAMINPAQDGAP